MCDKPELIFRLRFNRFLARFWSASFVTKPAEPLVWQKFPPLSRLFAISLNSRHAVRLIVAVDKNWDFRAGRRRNLNSGFLRCLDQLLQYFRRRSRLGQCSRRRNAVRVHRTLHRWCRCRRRRDVAGRSPEIFGRWSCRRGELT